MNIYYAYHDDILAKTLIQVVLCGFDCVNTSIYVNNLVSFNLNILSNGKISIFTLKLKTFSSHAD